MEKSEALRLADLIRSRHGNDINDEAAAELRRLHEENKLLHQRHHDDNVEYTRVLAQRDALLEALKEINSWLVCACIATPEDMAQSFPHMEQVAYAAIKAVEGEKT